MLSCRFQLDRIEKNLIVTLEGGGRELRARVQRKEGHVKVDQAMDK